MSVCVSSAGKIKGCQETRRELTRTQNDTDIGPQRRRPPSKRQKHTCVTRQSWLHVAQGHLGQGIMIQRLAAAVINHPFVTAPLRFWSGALA